LTISFTLLIRALQTFVIHSVYHPSRCWTDHSEMMVQKQNKEHVTGG